MAEYSQRSIIEAAFGAIKMHGDHLRSRRVDHQQREISIRIICYNVELVAGSHIKSGRINYEPLAAMAA